MMATQASAASPSRSNDMNSSRELDIDDMTEDQVSQLVENALMRARQATIGAGYRNAESLSSSNAPSSPYAKAPSTADRVLSTRELPRSPNYAPTPTRAHMDALLSPESDAEAYSVVSPTRYLQQGSMTESNVSVNSSDDILRKVEEEIANARKAANEAHRRLAGALKSVDASGAEDPLISPTELVDILEEHLAEDEDLQKITDLPPSVEQHKDNDDLYDDDPVVLERSKHASPDRFAPEDESQRSKPASPDSIVPEEEPGYVSERPTHASPDSIVPDDEPPYVSESSNHTTLDSFVPEEKPSYISERSTHASPDRFVPDDEPPHISRISLSSLRSKMGAMTLSEEWGDEPLVSNGSSSVVDAPLNALERTALEENVSHNDAAATDSDGSTMATMALPLPPPLAPPALPLPPRVKRTAESHMGFEQVFVDSHISNSNTIKERVMSQEVTRVADNKSNAMEFRFPLPRYGPMPTHRPTEEIIAGHELEKPEPFVRFRQPKPELKELLEAARGESWTRRSNACGALKVLSTQKKNKLTLVQAQGFLDVIVYVISQKNAPRADKDTALDARSRAVAVLLNVSEPKENRAAVCAHPNLLESLVNVIGDDQGEARAHACGTIAMLAKSPGNREMIAQVEGLVEILSTIIKGTIDISRPVLPLDDEEKEGILSDEGEFDDRGDDDDEGSSSGLSSSFSDCSTAPSDEGDSSTLFSGFSSSAMSPRSEIAIGNTHRSIRKQRGVKYEENLEQSRNNACAVFLHLSKHCPQVAMLSDVVEFMDSMIVVSNELQNPLHTRCLEIICNLTRFPDNAPVLAANAALTSTLLRAGKSKVLDDRIYALRAFQNMTSDASSKASLATAKILTLLSVCAMRKDHEEQCPAVAALYNLSTEAEAVVPVTSTRNVVATLVHLAHNTTVRAEIRQLACDALAMIALWLQTLAGAGKVPESVEKVLLPSHENTGWECWD